MTATPGLDAVLGEGKGVLMVCLFRPGDLDRVLRSAGPQGPVSHAAVRALLRFTAATAAATPYCLVCDQLVDPLAARPMHTLVVLSGSVPDPDDVLVSAVCSPCCRQHRGAALEALVLDQLRSKLNLRIRRLSLVNAVGHA